MRIVFMGTPDTAARALLSLIEASHEIVAVITQPDRPQGRHASPVFSAVKILAHQKLPNCSILQPQKAKEPSFIEAIKALKPEVIVVAAYGQILPKAILDIPPLGCINVHYSLLPELRGAAPIQGAILKGLKQTGVTIMQMVEAMDAGAILAQEAVALVPTLSAGELRKMLNELTAILLPATLEQVALGRCDPQEQDPSRVSFAPKIETKDAQIDWKLEGEYLQRLIRAMDPSPGAWCWVQIKGQQKRLKLFDPTFYPVQDIARLEGMLEPKRTLDMSFGHILGLGRKLLIAVKGGVLAIDRLQPEGKQVMSARAFAAGCLLEDLKMVVEG